MNPISYKELFDIDGLKAALIDLEQSEKQFATAVGGDLKNLQKTSNDLKKSLLSIRDGLNGVNITNSPGQEQLKALIGESDKVTAAFLKQNAAIQAGKKILADLAKETARLKKEMVDLDLQTKKTRLDGEKHAAQTKKTRLEIAELALATKQGTAAVLAAAGSYKEAQNRLSALGKEIRNAEGAFESQTPTVKAQIKEYNELNERLRLFDLQMGNHYRNIGNYKSGFAGLANSINQLTREFPSLAVNAQTFFLAISNNLPIFFDEIQQVNKALKASALESAASAGQQAAATAIAGGASEEAASQVGELAKAQALQAAEGKRGIGVLKAIGSSLLSWGTLLSIGITLLTVYGKEIVEWIGALFKGKEALDKAAMSLANLNKALDDTSFADAIKNVDELKIQIDLAKKGIADKEEVLKQYNDTIGKTTGQVESLDQAEKALAANANDYIQMTLKKAAANISLQEAAQKAVDIEKKRLKDAEEFASGMDKVNKNIVGSGGLFGMQLGVGNMDKAYFNDQVKKGLEQRKAAEIKTDEESKQAQLDIAGKFFKEAGEIAKKWNKDRKYIQDSELDSVSEITARIAELKKVTGSAIKGSDINNRIIALQARLKDLKGTTEETKQGFQVLEEQLSKVGLQIQIGLINGTIKSDADSIVKAYNRMNAELNRFKQSYEDLTNPKNRQFLGGVPITDTGIQAPDFSKFDDKQRKTENDKFFNNEIKKNALSIQQLEQLHNKKLISEEEYQQKLFATQYYGLVAQQGLYQQDSLEYAELETKKTALKAEQENKRIALQKAAAQTINDFLRSNVEAISSVFGDEFGQAFSGMIDNLDAFLQASADGFSTWQEQAVFAFQTLGQASKMVTADAISDSQLRISQLEDERAVELAGAGENAAAKKLIEADYNKRIAAERRKQAIAQKNQALFSIAINTASAYAATIGQIGFFGIPLATIVAALGLAQFALVAAKPIPQFYKGTNFSPEGPAEVAERGPEIIEDPDGSRKLVKKRSIIHLQRGSKVFTADQSRIMMKEGALDDGLSKMTDYNILMHTSKAEKIDYDRLIAGLGGEIRKIPFDEHHFDDRGYTRYRNEANSRVQDINARNSREGRRNG